MVKKLICLSAALLIAVAGLNAQSRSVLEEQAYAYLSAQDYAKAYEAFDKLYARYPK